MSDSAKTVILASARDELTLLAEPLGQQGWTVQHCDDGAQALQCALNDQPVLVVADTDLPLLPAAKLAQILRANPRTEATAFFFVGSEGEEVEGFRRTLDQFVLRPFNREQLLFAIAGFLGRQERGGQVGRQEQEVSGSLDQISLVDLLQVFGLNRKSGVLHLQRGEARGTVELFSGAVSNARIGRVRGEKAFFRLMSWSQGSFWFAPGACSGPPVINVPVDHLLMEGLRQQDELAAQRANLPGPEMQLTLKVPRERLPRGLRPATQEVLMLLEYHPRVADLLDHCPHTDFEILQILKVLLEKGLIVEARQQQPARQASLLTAEAVLAIRDYFHEADTLLESASAKLLLLVADPVDLTALGAALQGLPEFLPESDLLPSAGGAVPLGDLGRLAVGETFALRLFCLPATPAVAPWWSAFGRRLFGVAALGDGPGMAEAVTFFEDAAHLPVARVRLRGAVAAGEFPLARGDRAALRRLLAFFAQRFTGETLSEEVP